MLAFFLRSNVRGWDLHSSLKGTLQCNEIASDSHQMEIKYLFTAESAIPLVITSEHKHAPKRQQVANNLINLIVHSHS